MYKKQKIFVAVIPARVGSKEIKKKNIILDPPVIVILAEPMGGSTVRGVYYLSHVIVILAEPGLRLRGVY